jgi:hypothetical protein
MDNQAADPHAKNIDKRTMTRNEIVFLALAILGTILPLATFLPWLAIYGLDVTQFLTDLFANRVSAFFAWDVIISAIVVLTTLLTEREDLSRGNRTAVVLGTLLVGVSLGLPLLLFFRERARRRRSAIPRAGYGATKPNTR